MHTQLLWRLQYIPFYTHSFLLVVPLLLNNYELRLIESDQVERTEPVPLKLAPLTFSEYATLPSPPSHTSAVLVPCSLHALPGLELCPRFPPPLPLSKAAAAAAACQHCILLTPTTTDFRSALSVILFPDQLISRLSVSRSVLARSSLLSPQSRSLLLPFPFVVVALTHSGSGEGADILKRSPRLEQVLGNMEYAFGSSVKLSTLQL